MPGFDGTGPSGQGPMTGGGRGYCVVPRAQGSKPSLRYTLNPFSWSRGFLSGGRYSASGPFAGGVRGIGRGMGRGRRRW